jgi:hypothetical protein
LELAKKVVRLARNALAIRRGLSFLAAVTAYYIFDAAVLLWECFSCSQQAFHHMYPNNHFLADRQTPLTSNAISAEPLEVVDHALLNLK